VDTGKLQGIAARRAAKRGRVKVLQLAVGNPHLEVAQRETGPWQVPTWAQCHLGLTSLAKEVPWLQMRKLRLGGEKKAAHILMAPEQLERIWE
jgi:hypothetical protein